MQTHDNELDNEDRTHELAESINWEPVRILAVDLGAVSGFAIGSYGHVVSGDWNLRPNRYDGRLQAFKLVKHLEEWCRVYRPTRIVYHSSIRRSAGRKATMRGPDEKLLATLEKWSLENQLPCEAANRVAVRRDFMLMGNASGEALIEECKRRNFMPLNEKEAGAIATFHWALFDHIKAVGAEQPAAIYR